MAISENPWSDNPNAPQIKYSSYLEEKENIAGTFIAAILYGSLVHHLRISAHAVFGCLLQHHRDHHRSILSMHGFVTGPRQSYEDHQMEVRDPHRRYVLLCDGKYRDGAQPSICFLHRCPEIPWHQWHIAWTSWIPVRPLVLKRILRCSQYHVPSKHLAGRWCFGEFRLDCDWTCL